MNTCDWPGCKRGGDYEYNGKHYCRRDMSGVMLGMKPPDVEVLTYDEFKAITLTSWKERGLESEIGDDPDADVRFPLGTMLARRTGRGEDA